MRSLSFGAMAVAAAEKQTGAPIAGGARLNLRCRVVRMKGIEPSLRLKNSDLNAARLPIPPHPHVTNPQVGGWITAVGPDWKGDFEALENRFHRPPQSR